MEAHIHSIEPVGDRVRVVAEVIVILVAIMSSYEVFNHLLLRFLACPQVTV